MVPIKSHATTSPLPTIKNLGLALLISDKIAFNSTKHFLGEISDFRTEARKPYKKGLEHLVVPEIKEMLRTSKEHRKKSQGSKIN